MKLLMVCLGNICRSPVAEGVMRHKIAQHHLTGVEVDSAGTSNYHVGEHPDIRSQQNALKHQIDISKLKARQFTEKDFDDFDKIFVMDTSNYQNVLALARNESDKNKIELILNRLFPNTNQSVPDPYFGGEDGFENVFNLLDKACENIALTLKEK